MSKTHAITVPSPLGSLTVTATDTAIVKLDWGARSYSGGTRPAPVDAPEATAALLAEAARQLAAYFRDGSFRFDLPLAPAGTAYQRAVWDFMLAIPAGRTRSYGEAAAAINGEARSVGNACGANPIPVIIPCHRILAAGGDAGGYSGKGGLDTKRWLLRHEGAYVPSEQVSLF